MFSAEDVRVGDGLDVVDVVGGAGAVEVVLVGFGDLLDYSFLRLSILLSQPLLSLVIHYHRQRSFIPSIVLLLANRLLNRDILKLINRLCIRILVNISLDRIIVLVQKFSLLLFR